MHRKYPAVSIVLTNNSVLSQYSTFDQIESVCNEVFEFEVANSHESGMSDVKAILMIIDEQMNEFGYLRIQQGLIEDKEIKKGDYMGIGDSGILSNGVDMLDVTIRMIEDMMDEDKELISIYYGSEVSEETAEELREKIETRYPKCDVELQYGGQPIYYYIVSAE